MPPPAGVTCYICGRDFGTRSIGIHLPNCQKKWEAEQEKLPKKERRPLPSAPTDFDKVIKGEVKGKALAKFNQKAFDEHNETALESCPNCGRTFLPKALTSHKKACTEDKPMLKDKGASYTGALKAKVNYPKLKSSKKSTDITKNKKNNDENIKSESDKVNVENNDDDILKTNSNKATVENTSLSTKPPSGLRRNHHHPSPNTEDTAIRSGDLLEDSEDLDTKENEELSEFELFEYELIQNKDKDKNEKDNDKEYNKENDNDSEDHHEENTQIEDSNQKDMNKEDNAYKDNKKEDIIADDCDYEDNDKVDDNMEDNNNKSFKQKVEPKVTLTRGPGTFRKRGTFIRKKRKRG